MTTVETLLTTGITITGAAIVRFFERRHNQAKTDKIIAEKALILAQAEGKDIDNEKTASEVWERLNGALEKKVDSLTAQVNNLLNQNITLKLEMGHLKSENAQLKRQVDQLTRELHSK